MSRKRAGSLSISRGRKGQNSLGLLIVLIFAPILLIIVGFVFISIKPVYDDVAGDLKEQFGTAGDTSIDQSTASYPQWLDNAFIMMFGGFWIALLIASWYSVDHPIMAFILLIVVVSFIMVSGYVSNTWIDYIQSPDNFSLKASFAMTDFVLSNLVLIVLAEGFSCLALFFYRNSTGGIY